MNNLHKYPKYRINLAKPAWQRWVMLKELMQTRQITSPSKILIMLIDTWYNSTGIIEGEAAETTRVQDSNDLDGDNVESMYNSTGIIEGEAAETTRVQDSNDMDGDNVESISYPNGWPTVEIKRDVLSDTSDAEAGNEQTWGDGNNDGNIKFMGYENDFITSSNQREYTGSIKTEPAGSTTFTQSSSLENECDIKTEPESGKTKFKDVEEGNGIFDTYLCKKVGVLEHGGTHLNRNRTPAARERKRRSLRNHSEDAPVKKKQTHEKKKVPEAKPWIKIKLEDYEDRYRIETIESFARKNRNSNISESLYSCLVCEHYKCASRDTFEDHIEKHVNKAFECEKCNYTSYSVNDIRKHKQSCGLIEKGKLCDICGIFVNNQGTKKEHMGKVHNIAAWSCMFCPQMLLSRKDRLTHMREIHPGLCQYCNVCKKSKWHLSKEEFVEHQDSCSATQACEICGTVLSRLAFSQHVIEMHKTIRKFQCNQCAYASKNSQRLKLHLLTHSKVHPHKCDRCSFTCVQRTQLTSHMRTHTGEKPYKCTQCKYAAAWNVQLKDHVKAHSLETAVKCQQCDIVFKSERTLHMHLKKEHCLT